MWQRASSRFIEKTPYFLKDYSKSTLGGEGEQQPTLLNLLHMASNCCSTVPGVWSPVVPTQVTSRHEIVTPRITQPPNQVTVLTVSYGASQYGAKDKYV